jgi:transposase-like protein
MNRLKPEIKEKILKESYQEGCVITELAKKYRVPESTIYGWRGKDKKKNNIKEPKADANFIEVSVKEKVSTTNLKKAELIYKKFRIEIEGEISSSKIAPIMQILEGE